MYTNLSVGTIGVKATLPETIAYAKAHGFQGVDVSINEAMTLADEHGVDHVRNLFDEAGIRAGGWGFPVNFRQDEATWQADLEALPAQAKFASEMGWRRTATWLLPADDELTYQENFAFHVTRLRPAAQILADQGIQFGLEYVGPKAFRAQRKHTFVHTMDGVRALGAAIGTGNVGILVDSWHIYTSHRPMNDICELRPEEVVVVHVNDAPHDGTIDELPDTVRALPAETGLIDIVGFLQALRDIGYDGPVTAEPFSQRLRDLPADEAVAETAAAMDKIWTMAGLEN